jgi:glycerol-3-phosphate dehydrogenase
MLMRNQALEAAGTDVHDAVIVGGGVSGAALFRELGGRGYRVLLVDENDFTAGTSQASGMLIWGGLLYLKNLDFRTVIKLSAARDRMLRTESDHVREMRFRYLPRRRGGRSRLLVRAVLLVYWLLGQRRRRRPYGERDFPCSELLKPDLFAGSLVYEEAGLISSDCRFALGWILDQRSESRVAVNHCALTEGRWDRGRKLWELELEDRVGGLSLRARARTLINAGGVWADRINERCGIESAFRHVFSKGVYLAFERPAELDEALVFEMGRHGDSQTFTPWGPVALWGPTETSLERIEDGLAPDVGDVRFLLDQANRNLRTQRTPEDIVSMRCGIRPLAVKRDFRATRYPLELSRRHVVARDPRMAALTLYGGKLTSAPTLAKEAADTLAGYLPTRAEPGPGEAMSRVPDAPLTLRIPGMESALPDPAWCARHESCATLEDYLRRRTNLAQWIPRSGLGKRGENATHLLAIARAIRGVPKDACGSSDEAQLAVDALRKKVGQEDELLAQVST